MADWSNNWQSNKRKFWVRTDSIPYVPPPDGAEPYVRLRPRMAENGVQNGAPIPVPYHWNGAERYRQMGIAMSLFTVRQRIRRARADMIETVRGAR